MKTPTIEHHEFRPAKDVAEETDAKSLYTLALTVLPMALSGLFTGDWSWRGIGIGMGAVLAMVLLLWLLSRGDLLRHPERRALLRIGPQGIRSWSKLSAYIPWHRIIDVEPLNSDPRAYADFAITIEGPNHYSYSALARFFDNAVLRPIGGQPRFTISFENLEVDSGEVAALVGRIVEATKA
ncbi:MAG: hypothetical protein QNJ30_09740 [Kiloniellales bacterium]|nr:hypothetical protein [Kiloniellales bacterium]